MSGLKWGAQAEKTWEVARAWSQTRIEAACGADDDGGRVDGECECEGEGEAG